MRIVVFGAKGMLGSELVQQLQQTDQVIASNMDIANDKQLRVLLTPDLIYNCAGVRPPSDAARLIRSNALGPHVLAQTFDCPIIHVSTDCVFQGDRLHNYFVNDKPDAKSIYGRSKALGEVEAPHVANIRTSFIGTRHGFLRWLLDSNGTEVEGWTGAIWSGSTVQEVARRLVMMREAPPFGIQHLATLSNISKYELVKLVAKTLDLNITVRPIDLPMIWRGLRPTITMLSVKDCTDDLRS